MSPVLDFRNFTYGLSVLQSTSGISPFNSVPRCDPWNRASAESLPWIPNSQPPGYTLQGEKAALSEPEFEVPCKDCIVKCGGALPAEAPSATDENKSPKT